MRTGFIFLILVSFLSSCNHDSKYPYAIRDFRNSIQPSLNEMVSSGLVKGYGTAVNFSDSNISEKELKNLTLSEHPILRAEALGIMADRKGNNYSEVFMSHLDDTAMVTTDEGEFGFGYKTVSDYMLENSKWKSEEERNQAVENVVLKHNYLVSAYKVLLELEPQEKYYNIIKRMAQRDRPYTQIEYAILSLARYKKKEDVELIKNILLKNTARLDNRSFWLLKEFPERAYMKVFSRYAKYNYLQDYNDDYSSSEQFIEVLASYKNDSSALILKNLKDKLPNLNLGADKNSIKRKLYYAIWNNQCAAYSKLINEIKPSIMEYERKSFNQILRDTSTSFNAHRDSARYIDKDIPFIKWYYYFYLL